MSLSRDPKIRFICLDSINKNQKNVLRLNKIIDVTSLDTGDDFIKKLMLLYEEVFPNELNNTLLKKDDNGELHDSLRYIKNNLNDNINTKNIDDIKLKYFKWNYYRSRQARSWVFLTIQENKGKKSKDQVIQKLIGMACVGSHKIPNITLENNMTVNIAHLFIHPKFNCRQSYKYLVEECISLCESNNLIPTIFCDDRSLKFYRSCNFKKFYTVNNKYHFMILKH